MRNPLRTCPMPPHSSPSPLRVRPPATYTPSGTEKPLELQYLRGLLLPRAAPYPIPVHSEAPLVTPEQNVETAFDQRQTQSRAYGDIVNNLPGMTRSRIHLLEQRTVVGKPCCKCIHRRRGPDIPQCEHRPIPFEERDLRVEKGQTEVFYIGPRDVSRLCLACKKAGSRRGWVDRSVSPEYVHLAKEHGEGEDRGGRRTEVRRMYSHGVVALPRSGPILSLLAQSRRSRALSDSSRSDTF